MAKALLIVDVQPTFCEGGELPVAGGNTVAGRVAALLGSPLNDYDVVATSQDWHIDPAEHFSDNPDWVDTWPPHGLADTDNAAIHPVVAAALAGLEQPAVAVKKGQYAAAYSAFEGVDEAGSTLEQILRARGVDELDVCGIAESHCVRSTSLDALRLGFRVNLLTELTVPVTEEQGAAARSEIEAAGGTLV
jgi:nicotinamidase/pyrazinamidase